MNKEFLEKMIKTKRSQIEKMEQAMIECDEKDERSEMGETLKTLRDELNDVEKALEEVDEKDKEEEQKLDEENKLNEEEAQERAKKVLGTFEMRTGVETILTDQEKRTAEMNKVYEKRGKDLKEKRAISVEAGNLLLAEHQGTQLNETFNQVSTLVDMVATENLNGGESYKEAYVKTYGIGGITGEGKDYSTAEPEFGYAPMSKIKVTAYAEISEEVKKLPNIDYAGKVTNACMIALKKKLSQQIINGKGPSTTEGTDDEMVGIFGKPVAINISNDLDITAIDVNFMDEVMFSYGGDEDVEGTTATILNKNTLKDLSKTRKTDGNKEYEIDVKNKTINTIPYAINSNVPAFATATAGEFVGAYGDLKSYKVVTFSPVEIMESADFKFKQGMICYKASVLVAGNVIKQDGFLRLKKK